jgi:hypothetical protein
MAMVWPGREIFGKGKRNGIPFGSSWYRACCRLSAGRAWLEDAHSSPDMPGMELAVFRR